MSELNPLNGGKKSKILEERRLPGRAGAAENPETGKGTQEQKEEAAADRPDKHFYRVYGSVPCLHCNSSGKNVNHTEDRGWKQQADGYGRNNGTAGRFQQCRFIKACD